MLRLDFPIRTERLLLRPYGCQDLEYLADMAARPEVVRYLYEEVRDRQEVSAELELRFRLCSIQKEGTASYWWFNGGRTVPCWGTSTSIS